MAFLKYKKTSVHFSEISKSCPSDKNFVRPVRDSIYFYLNFCLFFVSILKNVVGCITAGLRLFFTLFFHRMTQKSFLCDVRYRARNKKFANGLQRRLCIQIAEMFAKIQ